MITRKISGHTIELLDKKNTVILSISEEIKEDMFYITLSGQLKNETAHDFEDELTAALSVCGKIVLNLEKVEYMASMSMKALLSIQQLMDEIEGSSLTLEKVTPEVMKIFNDYGFADMLQIEELTR